MDSRDIARLIDNAATASQCDFDDVTREAIKLNIVDKLLDHARAEYQRGRLDGLDAVTFTDSDGAIYNSFREGYDLREVLQ
jgi:hypothetical protein